MRIGLLGGTFDPVHQGHITIAQATLKQFELNHIYWIPAVLSPFKLHLSFNDHNIKQRITAPEHRLAMLSIALKNHSQMSVLDWELQRPYPSYTSDTLRQALSTWPQSHFFWIMGSDQLPKLQDWHEIEFLISHMTFLVYERPPYMIKDYQKTYPFQSIIGPVLPITATHIRHQSHQDLPLNNLDPDVKNYIQKHRLYSNIYNNLG